jgi:hypothetical protein
MGFKQGEVDKNNLHFLLQNERDPWIQTTLRKTQMEGIVKGVHF